MLCLSVLLTVPFACLSASMAHLSVMPHHLFPETVVSILIVCLYDHEPCSLLFLLFVCLFCHLFVVSSMPVCCFSVYCLFVVSIYFSVCLFNDGLFVYHFIYLFVSLSFVMKEPTKERKLGSVQGSVWAHCLPGFTLGSQLVCCLLGLPGSAQSVWAVCSVWAAWAGFNCSPVWVGLLSGWAGLGSMPVSAGLGCCLGSSRLGCHCLGHWARPRLGWVRLGWAGCLGQSGFTIWPAPLSAWLSSGSQGSRLFTVWVVTCSHHTWAIGPVCLLRLVCSLPAAWAGFTVLPLSGLGCLSVWACCLGLLRCLLRAGHWVQVAWVCLLTVWAGLSAGLGWVTRLGHHTCLPGSGPASVWAHCWAVLGWVCWACLLSATWVCLPGLSVWVVSVWLGWVGCPICLSAVQLGLFSLGLSAGLSAWVVWAVWAGLACWAGPAWVPGLSGLSGSVWVCCQAAVNTGLSVRLATGFAVWLSVCCCLSVPSGLSATPVWAGLG